MSQKNLSLVQRQSPKIWLGGMLSADPGVSLSCAAKIISEAKDCGLNMRDFLTLAVLPTDDEKPRMYEGLNGLEAAFAFLNLPFRDNLEQGVFLQAASDTFQKYPGTRAMFPEVIDSMLRWKNRQTTFETIEPFLAQSRTITGTELISTAVEDDSAARGSYSIAELGKIPVRTIRTSQTSVGIFKHGSGIKTSYEFERRASLDIMTPFAARVARELEVSKIRAATSILINGDGVNAAAPVTAITAIPGGVVFGTTPIRSQYEALMTWLVNRAAIGLPIDTIAGNLKMYLEILLMFKPTISAGTSVAEAMASKGAPGINVNLPALGGTVNFAYSSSMPDNKILGFSKGDTLEELKEAGSEISENEKSIQNQSLTYVRTENTGYKLAFGDTRSMLDFTA